MSQLDARRGSFSRTPPRTGGVQDELRQAGISSRPKELKEEFKAGKPPPGAPKTINGVKVYPARHFA